jgi:uncharacterized ferritin-like protein (DUF455 family)
MIVAQTLTETQVLHERSVLKKLANLPHALNEALMGQVCAIPEVPGRDVQILSPKDLPDKPGVSLRIGQARLLHDLASIELQAMELALRTLLEFPEAPRKFREELAAVCADEGRHLQLCLEGLIALALPWGSFPTHLALWNSVSREDSLLDRILIVHRYLEGSGLDASHGLLNRLSNVDAPEVKRAVAVIALDEIGHVEFGSRWYREICRLEGIEPGADFPVRLERLSAKIPRRLEKINQDLRKMAGFTEAEISVLNEHRRSQI